MNWRLNSKATFVAAGLLLAGALPAHAQSISGPAEAIDGDTLSLTGMHIRLFGIDAPEAKQTCDRAGTKWSCGTEAKTKLVELVDGKQVDCIGQDRDQYGRLVAKCRVGNIDLGEAMVLAGLATAFTKYSDDYVEAEAKARQYKLGIWSSQFEVPADWRAAHPEAEPKAKNSSASTRPIATRVYRDSLGRCAIKGNHSRRGDWIYHLPGRPYYDETRPEALFCTEEAALAAGYRPSRAR